ncbi:hypothetical protein [Granulicoccus phenolivorans]|uniref:hypothetical protein n=1 Tax=Granulicoccus phenolivorans TaxID=266854 RepID=UPI0004203F79|nr:hypothetical protein [Granulicoccus phenolivorans]
MPGPVVPAAPGLLHAEVDPLLTGTRRWFASNRLVAITALVCTGIALAVVIITVVLLQPGLPADPVSIPPR